MPYLSIDKHSMRTRINKLLSAEGRKNNLISELLSSSLFTVSLTQDQKSIFEIYTIFGVCYNIIPKKEKKLNLPVDTEVMRQKLT